VAEPDRSDPGLLADVALVRRIAALGQCARAADPEPADVWCRAEIYPLPYPHDTTVELAAYVALLAKLLAVEDVQIHAGPHQSIEWKLGLTPGRTFDRGPSAGEIQAALRAADDAQVLRLATQVRQGLSIGIAVQGQTVSLLPGDIELVPVPPAGTIAAADAEYLIILDQG
jgi:hypothetical protein